MKSTDRKDTLFLLFNGWCMGIITTIIALVLFTSCIYRPINTQEEIDKKRISWKIERQLNEQRLKDDCWKCDCCKGYYKKYNSSYILNLGKE